MTFTDYSAWKNALGGAPTTLIDFSGFPKNTPASTQYASKGIVFDPDRGVDSIINDENANPPDMLNTAFSGQTHRWHFTDSVFAVGWFGTSNPDTFDFSIFDSSGNPLSSLHLTPLVYPRFGGFISDVPIGSATSFSPNDDQRHSIDNIEFAVQSKPDIAATTLAWDTAQGGVDFGYTVSGAALTQDTTAQLYWASGTTTDTILEPAATPIPIPKTTPVGQEQSVHLAPSDFPGGPAPGTKYLLAVVDPDNKIAESDEPNYPSDFGTNNVKPLALPDVALTDATTTDLTNFQVKYDVSNTDLPSLKLSFYLSSDDVLGSGDALLATMPVTDLSVGINKVFAANLSDVPVGEDQRFVLVVANKDQDFFETDSSNNQVFAIPLLAVGDRINRMGDWGGPGTFPETSDDASGPYTGAILRGTDDFAKLVHLDAAWAPSPRFDFLYSPPGATPQEQAIDAEEDRLAQPSLLQPTSELVRLVNADSDRNPALWGRAIFSINEAYDSAGEHGPPPSLHYEGRALDIEPLAVSDARLSRLSGLAWLAGFDWVYYENSKHIHVSERASFTATINGASLHQAISTALDLGRIDVAGVANSLSAKLDDIDRLLAQNDYSAALGNLRAFSQEIQAQRGKHVEAHFADFLFDAARILEAAIKKRRDGGSGS